MNLQSTTKQHTKKHSHSRNGYVPCIAATRGAHCLARVQDGSDQATSQGKQKIDDFCLVRVLLVVWNGWSVSVSKLITIVWFQKSIWSNLTELDCFLARTSNRHILNCRWFHFAFKFDKGITKLMEVIYVVITHSISYHLTFNKEFKIYACKQQCCECS